VCGPDVYSNLMLAPEATCPTSPFRRQELTEFVRRERKHPAPKDAKRALIVGSASAAAISQLSAQ
jgi:hypothetical protein